MSDTARAILLGVFVLTASIWVGGYLVIAVVARVAARTLPPGQRVAFFRGLGRSYGLIGGAALLVALGTGAALLSERPWDATLTAATTVSATLVAATAVGMGQARRMTRLRHARLEQPNDAILAGRIRQGARVAGMLRAAIGLLSLTMIALGSLLAT